MNLAPAHLTRTNLPSKAVYAFSADPITNGHINVVERISKTFQEVVVGIGRNPLKNYLFTLKQRLGFAQKALAHLSNVRVIAFQGMVVDFACEQGANIIVKGVRNAADFDYEQTHHLVGLSQQVGIDTHILFADPALAHVSSSVVKAIQMEHGTLTQYVPLVVKSALEQKISKQIIIGVTGEIASGKSTLCKQLQQVAANKNIPLHHIDLDKLGHGLLEDNTTPMHFQVTQLLIRRFGNEICINGKIDRKLLAKVVFNDSKALRDFNTTMLEPMTILLRKSLHGKKGIILLNGALLVEEKLLKICSNNVILTNVCAKEQATRMLQRGYTEQEIQSRRISQWCFSRKKAAINNAISTNNFGRLWIRNTNNKPGLESAVSLLDQIIDETNSNALIEELTA